MKEKKRTILCHILRLYGLWIRMTINHTVCFVAAVLNVVKV